MKKLLLGLTLLLLPMMSIAGPLCSLNTSLGSLPCAPDTGDEFFSVSDIDGVDDDITSFILDRNAGFSNSAGIYDPFNTANNLELWSGTTAAGFPSGRVLEWNGVDTYALANGGASITLSNALYLQWFGVYLDDGNGNRFYSDSSLNAGDLDHLMTYNTEGLGGATNGFDITFGWEDLSLGDADYNDLIFGCIDCTSGAVTTRIEQVPVPQSGLLMGLGLMLMGVGHKLNGKKFVVSERC